MSDSDSTFVAADDFGSRFLEFDEYTYEKPDDIENDGFAPFLPYFHPQVLHKSPSPDNQSTRLSKRRKRRAIKTGNRGDEFIAAENVMKSDSSSSEDEDDDDSAEEEELYSSRYHLKQPLTARQISLHSQKYTDPASVKTLNQSSDECLNPVKSSTTDLTQEQIAARQKKIDQRKETAKLKVETEKRQLVERLLKISSNGVSGRGRGRGRRIQTNDSPSREDHDDNVLASQQHSDNEVYAESAEINSTEGITPPPPQPMAEDKSECISVPDGGGLHTHPSNPNYIRFISSSRLSEPTVICLPATHDYLHANFNKPTNETPKLRMCNMGCGCVRRYECPKTGRSLCSLSCYKANLAQIQKSPSKIVST